jgi:hypothetical protein
MKPVMPEPVHSATARRDSRLIRVRALSVWIAGGAVAASLGLGTAFAQALPGHARISASRPAGSPPTAAPSAAAPSAATASAGASAAASRPLPRHHRTLAPPAQPPASTPPPPASPPAPPVVSSGGS